MISIRESSRWVVAVVLAMCAIGVVVSIRRKIPSVPFDGKEALQAFGESVWEILLPVIIVFCVVGSFGLDNTMFDVWVMLVFGLIGFALERARYPLGPFVIGFVLAPLMEEKLRSGLMMTAGSITPIFTRPVALVFLIAAVALLTWSLVSEWRQRRAAQQTGKSH